MTDNKNRTVSEVRNVLSKRRKLGTKGSVAHLFRRVGVMKIERMKEDDLFNHMDSVDLLDIEQVENGCIIITNSSELFNTKKYFETHGFSTFMKKLSWILKLKLMYQMRTKESFITIQ